MDIISHAVAGASTGMIFNRPVLGALIAIIPDLPIFGPRKSYPPKLYTFFHSFLFLGLASYIGLVYNNGWLVFFCLVSHLVLDFPTHGKIWGPKLLYPSKYTLMYFEEWEFFNRSWWIGLIITLIWCLTCLKIAYH